jgi:hypothetical protein
MRRNKLLILFFTVFCMQVMFVQQPAAEGPKSKFKALTYSLVCTLGPIAASIPLLGQGNDIEATNNVVGLTIGSLGLLCGPGAGHLYAKNEISFVKGVIIRGAAGAIAVYSLSKIEIFGDNDNTGPGWFFVIGGSTFVVSAIHDISTTGKSVDRYNEQHGFSQFNLQPCYFANSEAPGLLLSMRF